MVKQDFVSKKSERFGIYSYFVGQNMVFIIVTMFLSAYYLSALSIPAETVAAILLIARVWDAINDPMLSIFVEKANLKGGKFKPWIRSVAIAIPVLTVVLFSFTDILSGMPLAVRVAYATITYILWGMAYTVSDAPAFALITVMTPDANEKNTIMSFARMTAMIGILIAFIILPIAIGEQGNYFLAALIISALALVFMLQINKTEERIESTQKSPSLKQIISAIIGNRYVVIFVIVSIILNGFNFVMSITPQLSNDVFNNPMATTVIMMSTVIPILFTAPFVPKLIKRFGKILIYKCVLIMIVLISLITYLIGYDNFTLFLVLTLIKGFVLSPTIVMGSLFFADAIEYDFFMTGKRFEAAVFSARTFSTKATTAIAGGLGMALLGMSGYQESFQGDMIQQSQTTIDNIWLIYNLGPALGALLALLVFWKYYDLSEKKLEVLSLKKELE